MKSKVILFLSSILLFSSIISLPANAGSIETVDVNEQEDFFMDLNEELNIEDSEEVFSILTAIENIPDQVLDQGAEATAQWIGEYTGLDVIVENGNLVFPEMSQENDGENEFQTSDEFAIETYGLLNCISVVGLAIAGNGIPFTKIFKLKKALDMLGGVTKAIKRIQAQYKWYRSQRYRVKPAFQYAVKDVSKTLKKDVQEAFLDFFGITAIITACSNLDS